MIAESFVAESLGDGFEGDGLVVQVDPVDSVQAGATNDSATKVRPSGAGPFERGSLATLLGPHRSPDRGEFTERSLHYRRGRFGGSPRRATDT